MQRLFVSKNRQVKCTLIATLHEITGIPLVTGTYSVRWKIRGVSEGQTDSFPLKHHSVIFDGDSGKITTNDAVFVIGVKDGVLLPVELKLTVVHAFGNGRTETVGSITINLAEYVGLEPKMRRYLLESKFNSTVRLTLSLKPPVSSDIVFERPPITDSQIFSDVTEAILGQQTSPSSAPPTSSDTTSSRSGTMNAGSGVNPSALFNSSGSTPGVPKVSVKSGHMSLRRALNHHEKSLKGTEGVPMAREGDEAESAQDIVDKILAGGAIFE